MANPGEEIQAAGEQRKTEEREDETKTKLAIRSSTPMISSTSGYAARVAVTNTSSAPLDAGSLSASTNSLYTFSSRIDMQGWAEGGSRIPTPNQLAAQPVGVIQPGQSVEVTLSAPADDGSIKAMATWGPKPLLLTYQSGQAGGSGKQVRAAISSFLTRSQDGLTTAQTPPMTVSMLMPLTTTGWTSDQGAVKRLMTGERQEDQDSQGSKHSDGQAGRGEGSREQTDPSQILSLNQEAQKVQNSQMQLVSHHPNLNVVADPTYLAAFENSPKVDAVMQPAAFDLTAYSSQDAAHYASAGVQPTVWSADQTGKDLQAALGASSKTIPTYAWQGRRSWSMDSLTQARQQGYQTVVAPLGLDAGSGSSAHTGKYTVPTAAGEVTVLSAQQELSDLAQGQPTSTRAAGEQTPAGQTARFMAQSAFYQMEQPYSERPLLVCFGTDQDAEATSALMDAAEKAPWLKLSGLDALNQAQAYQGGEAAKQTVAQANQANGGQSKDNGLSGTLDSLTASRQDISRFGESILATPSQAQSTPSASSRSDAQALARQDAANAAHRSDDPRRWLNEVSEAHDTLALHTLACTNQAASLADSARALADQLLGGIQIRPSESITVVSETATMPVTVSNSHPYPVAARVSAKTDSMEIATTRTADTVIPANSEAQVTFTIRVATAGQATAEISLVDRQGRPFGQTQATHINSHLRLSDMSGLIIVVAALLFGALGLWRQFHRKKDPDE
ncbi:hypothetical protein AB656_05700 [Bifidobacterium actinocoloniiforme DSM 22766]|nr:hypothetical protein AB656_05700 [Bifidobacterium actinocoloniiforme DSM 22766]